MQCSNVSATFVPDIFDHIGQVGPVPSVGKMAARLRLDPALRLACRLKHVWHALHELPPLLQPRLSRHGGWD